MALLICAPTPAELSSLAPAVMPAALPEQEPLKTVLRGREVVLCVTGVGPVNAATAAGLCLGGFRISGCLLAGLAGAFNLGRFPLGSLCLVREEIWPEYGLNDGNTVTARAFRFPQFRSGKSEIYDRLDLAGAEALCQREPKEDMQAAVSLTVAGVSASFERAVTLAGHYGADLENMEGFAVALACLRRNVPCVEIRSISNKVGPRAPAEKDFAGALRSLGRVLPALRLL